MKLNDQRVSPGRQTKIILVKNKEKIIRFRGRDIPGFVKVINKKWVQQLPKWTSYMEWEVQLNDGVEVAVWRRNVEDTRSWRTAVDEFRKNLRNAGSINLPETLNPEIENFLRGEIGILAEMMDDIRKKNRSPG